MEIFGWFSLIILALIGVGTIAAFVGPNVVEKVKTIIYQAKKFAVVAKEYIDAKAEIKRAKNAAKLAAKQNKQEEKVEEVQEEPKAENKVEEVKPVEEPKQEVEENTVSTQEQNSQPEDNDSSNVNPDNNLIINN